MEKNACVYIMTNKNNTTLYIGVTSDLVKRVWEHKNHIIDGFTSRYNIEKLVYFEVIGNIESAINREKYLKGKTRQYKINLIESANRDWKDLYK